MEQMLREWRSRNDERLRAEAAEGWPTPYRRIAIVAASYLAWGLVVFWGSNMIEHNGVWLAILYWLSNPVLLVVAGCRALLLDGQEGEALVRYEFGEERDLWGR